MNLRFVLLLIFTPSCLCELADVTNLEASSSSSTIFSASWIPPVDFTEGDTYQVHILQNETQNYYPSECGKPFYDETQTTSDTNFLYYYGNPDFIVYLTVSHVRGDELSKGVTTVFGMSYQAPDKDLGASYKNKTIITETEVDLQGILNWHFPCPPGGNLTFEIELMGTYSEDTSISTSKLLDVPIVQNYEQSFDLKEYLNYSFNYEVRIKPRNEVGTGKVSVLTFKTDPNYPGKPQNLIVEDTGTEVTVSWEEPEEKWGKIVNYHVELESLGPAPGGFDCEEEKGTKIVDTTDLTTTFKSKSYYSYNVRVSAETTVGRGQANEADHQTKTSPPEAVDELKVEDKSVDNHQDNVELNVELNWKSPCTSNGKLMLILELNGQYTEDPTNTQSQNFSIEGTTQNFDVSKYLKYSYDYNATIISSNEEGEGGKNTIAFKTSPNYPGEIKIKNVSYNDQNMKIEWTEPESPVGKVAYDLSIKPKSPISYDCSPNNTIIQKTTEDVVFETPVMPYYNYEITITPSTDVGAGKSVVKEDKSPPSESDVVAHIGHSIANKSTTQDYNTEVTVTFGKPCRFNDEFHSYVIEYIGTRNNFEKDSHTEEILEVDITYVYSKLKPQYDYTVSVVVKTENFESKAVQEKFSAPAGVPIIKSEIINMTEVTLKEYNLAEFTLKKSFFDDTNGDIVYCAIILSEKQIPTAGKYAYWGGTSDYWPETGSDNTTYVTDKMWNPFTDSNQVQVSIGDKIELNEKTTYYFVVRAFTKTAFIDSMNINFTTDEEESSQLAIILGATFGGLAILILLVVGILWKLGKLPFNKSKAVIQEVRRKTAEKISTTEKNEGSSEKPEENTEIKGDVDSLKAVDL